MITDKGGRRANYNLGARGEYKSHERTAKHLEAPRSKVPNWPDVAAVKSLLLIFIALPPRQENFTIRLENKTRT